MYSTWLCKTGLNSAFFLVHYKKMKSLAISRFHANNNNGLRQNYSMLKRFFSNKTKEKSKSKLFMNEEYETVVGLEIHAQITSQSKLFSGASTEFCKPINSSVSFFDCATPGTLPVLNRRCVEAGVLSALSLSCKVNELSLFDRKHYFYPDLPAGYQITQQRQPLAVDGEINFYVFTPGIHKEFYPKSSKLKQIQLEQDSGRTLYDEHAKKSYIDLNRAGIPLMEFVFEPDLCDGEEAAALVKELVLILQRLNTCSCKMDEGALRIDANVSINLPNEPLGVRTELKNIFSVRSVAAAINYEIRRQINMRKNGKEIINETRSWDVEQKKTISMRHKEDKYDYRFMPEPNLAPLQIHVSENAENKYDLVDAVFLKTQLPELPAESREKLSTVYKLPTRLISSIMNVPETLQLLNYIMKKNEKLSAEAAAKTLIHEVLTAAYKSQFDLENLYTLRDHIVEIVELKQTNQINILTLRKILDQIISNPESFPKQIVEKNNWYMIDNEEEIKKICKKVIDDNPKLVIKYKNGKQNLLRKFIHNVILSDDRVNAKKIELILVEMLK